MDKDAGPAGDLRDAPQLADALESNRFKQFLDHLPFAVVVSELQPTERITYANPELERLTGLTASSIEGKSWDALPKGVSVCGDQATLSEAIVAAADYLGAFSFVDLNIVVDAWSNVIRVEDGTPMFRLVALSKTDARPPETGEVEERIREKDVLLREIQHRVKNNLQMITTLIRLEAKNVSDDASGDRFDRLAGRVGSLAILYDALSPEGSGNSVDLGVYLSQIASAVMQAHAVEGIRLDLKVDAWPVSINVAMPTGLVVNELLTNSLKHAFVGRAGGTVFVHSLVDSKGCRVVVGDDGGGFADGATWPRKGKLGAMIVESLRNNAKARIEVESAKDRGVRVTITFDRDDAAPEEG